MAFRTFRIVIQKSYHGKLNWRKEKNEIRFLIRFLTTRNKTKRRKKIQIRLRSKNDRLGRKVKENFRRFHRVSTMISAFLQQLVINAAQTDSKKICARDRVDKETKKENEKMEKRRRRTRRRRRRRRRRRDKNWIRLRMRPLFLFLRVPVN